MAGGEKARVAGPAAGTAEAAFDALAALPRLSELTQVARAVLLGAAERRRAHYADSARVVALAEELGIGREDCVTPFGNGLAVLEAGPEDEAERMLVAALAAHALAEAPPKDPAAEDAAIADLLWLSTHAAVDVLPLLDRAVGDGATELWRAVGETVRRIDAGKAPSLGRGEAIVGAAALSACAATSRGAAAARTRLVGRLKDPLLARLVSAGAADTDEGDGESGQRFEGELMHSPRGPLATTLLAFTGALFALSALRLIGRLALSYKRPAEVVVTARGVRVHSRTLLLGRTLREQQFDIQVGALRRATRDVRYPRAGLYAGLFALAIGSYVGLSAFVDGIRSASPSLLLTGLLFVAAGIGLDFVLGSAFSGARGRCRVVFLPATGKSVCVADVDPKRADLALTLLRGR